MKSIARPLHRRLVWWAAAALCLWALSGVLHPIMTTFGVQQAVMAPPKPALHLEGTRPIASILQSAGIATAQSIQVVPYKGSPLLQVTVDWQQPRRYFNLASGAELPNHDLAQAAFVAQHYLGLPEGVQAERTTYVTHFSTDYPSVNRLLPVYKLEYPEANGMVAYVYTGNNSMAAVTDRTKQVLQTTFQWLHTWQWMPASLNWLRTLCMSALLLALLCMPITGLVVFVKTRTRSTQKPWARVVHRWAGLALALPLLAWASSGWLHLLMNTQDRERTRQVVSAPIQAQRLSFDIQANWTSITQGMDLAGLSVVQTPAGEVLYRLAMKPQSTADGMPILPEAIRNARFDGAPITGPAVYINAETGQAWNGDDRTLARRLAAQFTGQPDSAIESAHLLTRFNPEYDFRNKRLPVWQITYGPALNNTVFIDTQNGVLVDQVSAVEKPERWSFSWLHKWNMLQAFGRDFQNWASAGVALACVVLLASLGAVKLTNATARRRTASGHRPVKTGPPAQD